MDQNLHIQNQRARLRTLLNLRRIREYKVVILGDRETGKTSFLQRHIEGVERSSDSNAGLRVYPMDFRSSVGRYRFNCWDTVGEARSSNFQDAYINNAMAAIVMIDVTRIESLNSVPRIYRDIRRVCEDIPIILCGNKVDMDNKQVHARQLVRHIRRYDLAYIEISALSNYNFEKPFLSLITTLDAGEDSDVRIHPMPGLLPPQVEFDIEAQMQREEELEIALELQ